MTAPQAVVAEAQGPAGEAERGLIGASDLRGERIMTQLVYAGIGSRATPPSVLEAMTTMATWLARRGWHLHSGGAAGADFSIRRRCPFRAPAPCSCPGPDIAGHAGSDCRTLSADRTRRCLAIAADLHPAWHRCSPAARKLHARNAAILLGRDADTPVHAVVAFTPEGAITGGTGMGIRIARRYGIPVLNLGTLHPRAVCELLEEIRTAATPGTRRA